MEPRAKIVVEVIYQNIQEVVNLKCEECHVKLKDVLKCLKQIHSKNHKGEILSQIEPKATEIVQESDPQTVQKSQNAPIENPKALPNPALIPNTPQTANSSESEEIEIEEVKLESVSEPESDPESNPNEFYDQPKSIDAISRRKLVLTSLTKFLEQEYQLTLETSIKNRKKLEEYLIEYLKQYRTIKNEVPKWKTLEHHKSNMKSIILEKSRNKLNLLNVGQFPKFNAFYKEYLSKLRETLDKVTRVPIPEADVVKIYQFLTYLHCIMNGSCTDLSRIPAGYQDRVHYLVRSGLVFILLSYLPKRDPSKWCELLVKDFEIINHPEFGKCFQEINDPDHFIPFSINKYGLSTGQFLEDYIKKLKPFSKWLLSKPKAILKKGDFQCSTVWYEHQKIGANMFGSELPGLTSCLKLPKYTPAQVTQIKMKTDNQEEAKDPLADPPNKKIKIEVDEKDGSHFVFLKST